MPKTINTIKNEIEEFKVDNGGTYSQYYIGITNDLDRRLIEVLNEHVNNGNREVNDPYYSAEAFSRDEAFETETYFQELGMKQYNPGGQGVEDSHFVYCFKLLPTSAYLLTEENALTKNINRMKHLMGIDEYIKSKK